jgi:hypothetical protein
MPDTKWYQALDSTEQLFTNPVVYISNNSSILQHLVVYQTHTTVANTFK